MRDLEPPRRFGSHEIARVPEGSEIRPVKPGGPGLLLLAIGIAACALLSLVLAGPAGLAVVAVACVLLLALAVGRFGRRRTIVTDADVTHVGVFGGERRHARADISHVQLRRVIDRGARRGVGTPKLHVLVSLRDHGGRSLGGSFRFGSLQLARAFAGELSQLVGAKLQDSAAAPP